MVDTRTPEQRRRIMQSVKTKDTGAELIVRRILHRAGYRYRLHRRDLPGSPDIVFPGRKKAIFVHGCFWHGHGCAKGRAPKSRTDYWQPKIEANQARDVRNLRALQELGWEVLVLWQCELGDEASLTARLAAFVDERTISIDKAETTR
ncbi:MAG: very short patch repair endonuclease [Mesorhizobium sp.]